MCKGKWNTGLIPVASLLDTYCSVGFLYSGKIHFSEFFVGFVCLFIWGFGVFLFCLVWVFYSFILLLGFFLNLLLCLQLMEN